MTAPVVHTRLYEVSVVHLDGRVWRQIRMAVIASSTDAAIATAKEECGPLVRDGWIAEDACGPITISRSVASHARAKGFGCKV